MGLSFKDALGIAVNPVALLGTGLAGGGDLYLQYRAGQQAADAQREANELSRWQTEQNINLQREFARSGIQWRVEDARAAGINPIYALGAGGASFTPVTSAFTPVTGKADSYSAMGATLSNMGQNISRAVLANADNRTREEVELENQVRLKALRNQNKLLDFEFTRIGQPENPPMPSLPVAQTSYGDQMVESTETPGRFYLMPSMETAMASQGDWIYPLTNRARKVFSHYKNLMFGNNYLSTRFAPMPKAYSDLGYDAWKREWDGMFVPAKTKDYGTKNW